MDKAVSEAETKIQVAAQYTIVVMPRSLFVSKDFSMGP